jgi:hypothetical protein
MARLINLFAFTGSIGNMVGFCRNGKYFVRSKPVRRSKKTYPAQIVQQAKFSKAVKMVTSLSPLLNYTIPAQKRMTGPNFVTSHILKHAIFGIYPDIWIDYSRVPVSNGTLQKASSADAVSICGNLIFTWNNLLYDNTARENDKAVLIAYCEELNQSIYSIHSTVRSTGIATLSVNTFKGYEVQTWLAFKSENGKLTSNSTYTGSLFVT